MKNSFLTSLLILLSISSFGQSDNQVRGWNILSDYLADDTITINAATAYKINHLQLSHDVVMNLQEIRNPEKRKLVNDLASRAHKAGISEVIAWDHALYSLKYYPEKFRTGPDGTINLDNPEFWKWFKQDYRDMLSLCQASTGWFSHSLKQEPGLKINIPRKC